MDHLTYLDTFEKITRPVMSTLALQLAQGDSDDAAAALTELRAQQDALWDEYSQSASEQVAP